MPNFYVHRGDLKSALSIRASATADHALLDTAAEAISRLIDDYVGYHFYPASGTRYYTPIKGTYLSLDYPLLNVDAIQTSSNGGSTYGSTMTSNDYYLAPYNATEESPRRPWWGIEIRPTATSSGAVFPMITRGARILGTWGYYDERVTSTAVLATGVANATVTTITLTGATSLHPGQTIRIDDEQMFVEYSPTTSTGAHTSGVTVKRAQNGTPGATHASGTAIQIYTYPIVGQAAKYQAQQDYRVKDAPMGAMPAQPFGTERPTMAGGLHPFTRRMLDGFRKPVIA